MVDNVAITAGSGTTLASDDIGGVQYPRVKISQGADGSATDVSSAAPLNVTLANGTVPSHAVTNAGTFVTQENGAALTALQLIDDTIVAQGTALGTTKNSLIGGSVTTAAPTYTTGQISPLSLDTSGALRVSGAGGGTQYTEDVAAATDPVGNMLIAVRKDTLSTSEVSADGDNIALKATNKGKLHVAAELRSGDTVLDTGVGTGGSATIRVAMDTASQNANGRASAANSTPVVLSNEDKAALVDDAAFTPGTSNVNMVGFQADESSTDSVDEGDAGAARMTLDRKIIVTQQPHTAGGFAAPFYSLDLDETEELVKTGAGCLYKIRITNRTTSARYVKLYDGVLAGVTVGSTTPLDTIPVPAGGSADLATVLTESFGGLGLPFTTGLCIACTTGFADNDTGAPGTNDVIVSAYYK